jgi:hypothetical protein
MLNRAIKQIEGCFSLPDLRDLWAENAEGWKAFPGDQAAEIVRVKDKRKRLLESGRQYPVVVAMVSSILGAAVDVMLWPDRATVAGVPYTKTELTELISRGLPADDLRAVHEVKKSFNGEVKK